MLSFTVPAAGIRSLIIESCPGSRQPVEAIQYGE
jgi:hypothetical protein